MRFTSSFALSSTRSQRNEPSMRTVPGCAHSVSLGWRRKYLLSHSGLMAAAKRPLAPNAGKSQVTTRRALIRARQVRSTPLLFLTSPASSLSTFPLLVFLTLLAIGSFRSVESRDYHIAAVFQSSNFSDLAQTFKRAVSRLNTDTSSAGSSTPMTFKALALPVIGSPLNLLVYTCDAVFHANISAFVVIGDQNTINTVSIVTKHIAIPILGYNIERKPVMHRVSYLTTNRLTCLIMPI